MTQDEWKTKMKYENSTPKKVLSVFMTEPSPGLIVLITTGINAPIKSVGSVICGDKLHLALVLRSSRWLQQAELSALMRNAG